MTAPADLRAALDRADAARAVARAGGSRPIDHALRNLRHLYEQMISGGVRDTASAARGLLGPAIVGIEPFGRKNNDQGYSPDNCCWATRAQQMRNQSRTKLTMIAVETAPGREGGER